ncbi:MAG: hypothetical protein U1A77_10280 [Pirellulales bacterium]
MVQGEQPERIPQAQHGPRSTPSRHDKRARLDRPKTYRVYDFPQALGQQVFSVAAPLLSLSVKRFESGRDRRWKMAIDDSVSKFQVIVEGVKLGGTTIDRVELIAPDRGYVTDRVTFTNVKVASKK